MNVFAYSAMSERFMKEVFAEPMGIKMETTFYSDLAIAEWFGIKSIKETYKNIVQSWGSDIKYISEFALCLGWKSWEFNSDYNPLNMNKEYRNKIMSLYSDLFYKLQNWVDKHYKDDEKSLSYFYNKID